MATCRGALTEARESPYMGLVPNLRRVKSGESQCYRKHSGLFPKAGPNAVGVSLLARLVRSLL
jgi:hypothetical protein